MNGGIFLRLLEAFASFDTILYFGKTNNCGFFVHHLMERKIYNPIQKDQVVFLKTAADTNGACTLVEVTLADGGGVGLHYHKTYAEKFETGAVGRRSSW